MIKGRLRDMNLTQREDVCFSHGGERNSSTAAVGQRKFGGGASSAVAQAMTSSGSSSSREALMNATGTELEGCEEARLAGPEAATAVEFAAAEMKDCCARKEESEQQ